MVTMMSTGEEPPKGFEGYFTGKKTRATQGDLSISCVTPAQLTAAEVAELDELRTRALDNYCATTGNEVSRVPITEELTFVPSGATPAETFVFRAYQRGTLVAYAQVLCGWPRANEWTVEQLLLDPSHRLKGIGTKVIGAIENLARTAEVRAASILSLPSRPGAESFWSHLGYEDKTSQLASELGNSFINIMRKVL